MSTWTPVEKAYSIWLRAAREKKGSAADLGRELEAYLRKTYRLGREGDLRKLGVETELTGRTIGRWEKGTPKKPQPQYPGDRWSREALVAVVTGLVPVAPTAMEWETFQKVCEKFAADRLERIERGTGNLESHASIERNKKRHQFLATWPSRAEAIDPVALGLGSWAFDGALPPYVPRSADSELSLRLKQPGITTVTGAPKSGKSRSILEVLQRQHPEAVTWWVNPSPNVLPLVVEHAKKAKGDERPAFIVLDDASLIGTDPTAGLTARRLLDLSSFTHLIVVIHSKTFADWDRQLVHHIPGDASAGMGVTRELMDLLELRVSYASILNEEEAVPAAEIYDNADDRVKSFDLNRLAETLAGVETLLRQAAFWLETSTSVEAALLEAAIDASIAFPAGASEEILGTFARVHYGSRQPNRPWREHQLEDALDTLATGIASGSPHAILVKTDHNAFRILDALAAGLQHPQREVLATLTASNLRKELLDVAFINTGIWHWRNSQKDRAAECWVGPASNGHKPAMVILGGLASEAGDTEVAHMWWSRAAELGNAEAMVGLGSLEHKAGNTAAACAWWGRAAHLGHVEAMSNLAVLADETGDTVASARWWKRAAGLGHVKSIFALVSLARLTGDTEAMRRWLERAARLGSVEAIYSLGGLAFEWGDTETAKSWWERAAEHEHVEAMYGLGSLAYETDATGTAKKWWKRAAEKDHPEAALGLGNLAYAVKDTETARIWWERGAELGNAKAMFGLGSLAYETGDSEAARECWERAAQHNHPEAMFNLGTLAYAKRDKSAARIWWERAADEGSAEAMFNRGALSKEAGDTTDARRWWERAANQGDTDAIRELQILDQRLDI